MNLFYTKNYKLKLLVCFLLLSSLVFISPIRVAAQVKDSTITTIYTSFKNYWTSGTTNLNTIFPDTSHNLLAFTFRGKTYSTGVNNAILNTNLGSTNYSPQTYKALPISNIAGNVVSGSSTYIATAIKNDGDSTKAAYTAPYPVIHIADVLTDGKNGLDLGTGVTNLPKGAHISFNIKIPNAKASTDSVPDLLFTQIADPSSNEADTIFFFDAYGNIVGNKKLVYWNNVSKLGTYKLDLYTLTNTSCNASTINGVFQQNTTRDIRMVAFLLTEFGITNVDSVAKVKGIQINPNGTSDQAFIAYNTNILTLDAPLITAQPQSQTFCSNTTTSATFSVTASSGTAMTYQWKKNGAAIAGATTASYTATGLTLADTANAYAVTVTNSIGSVTSDPAYVKYTIITQPSNQYVATGSAATFTVKASGATAFQWYKNGAAITSATAASYTISPTTLSLSGSSYYVAVTYSGGTCTSNTTTLTVENRPAITGQPQAQILCTGAVTSATFSITASSTSAMSYQWYKNGTAIPGATAAAYTASGLTFADTANTNKVVVTNGVGATTSNSVGIKYIILTQPTGQYVATGTAVTFSVTASGATAYQWQKGGTNITGATSRTYTIASAALSDTGNYTVIVTHAAGTCTSNAATLTVENRPVITTQPLLQVLCNNTITSATYSVVATSTSALSYQWYKNGSAISGATSNSYTATGLTYADTTNTFYVVLTNGVGSTTSSSVGLKYLVLSQPSSLYLATGSQASFSVTASAVATNFQWQKDGNNISGATSRTYTIGSVALSDSGSYSVVVSYLGGSCTSNAATLSIENLPVITSQPQQQVLCTSSTKSATFSIAATSVSALSYQWYKNGSAISGATSSSYTATGLTYNDTTNTYYVVLTNGVGSVTSNTTSIKYLILSQPASAYLATGNTISFNVTASSVATAFQWKKDGANIAGAKSSTYTIDTVTTASAAKYKVVVSYTGGTCTSSVATLTTSVVLYSKAAGNISDVNTWGVQVDGSGSTPVDFTRAEHTFVVANRDTATTTANINIAGTYDVGDGITTLTGGTTFEAGNIIRSLTKGGFAGTATSALIVHGTSDLYFDNANNTMQSLTISTTDTVKLHTALNMAAGSGHGIVKVTSGIFNTGDSLTLKSDALGTAGIGSSAGTIIGKVTVERFILARRAWRLFCAPVAKSSAQTINAAWQEGSNNSTDNLHPGYGTHITYGAESDGYDQNPQKSFSMYVYNNMWSGVPATKNTLVTDYNAYMFFIRGDRSYDIRTTTNFTTPLTTIIRTIGNVNQGVQAAIPVNASGFTLIGNPYASPVNFESIYQHSTNLAHHLRIWNPELGGTKGVGAFVLLYWDGSDYSAVPNIGNVSALKYIQADQGFFVESNGSAASISIMEADKDTANIIVPFGRRATLKKGDVSKLEVNLKVFNEDSTTSIADGVAYLFDNTFNDSVDNNDIIKIANTNESLSIAAGSSLLTMEQRGVPADNDSLHLRFTGTKTTTYQLEVVPSQISSNSMFLYDKYLNTLSPVKLTDTSRFNISINTAIAASKASDRFTIIVRGATVLPVAFTKLNAYTKDRKIQVDWSVANEKNIRFYEVEKSCTGNNFTSIGEVVATGNNNYIFTDATPCNGNNYYRIKGVGISGEVFYTPTANTLFKEGKPFIAVHPNPVTSSHLLLEMKNQPAGKYQLSLISNTGQVVYKGSVVYDGISAMLPVSLPPSLAKGIYQLKVLNNGTKASLKILCNF